MAKSKGKRYKIKTHSGAKKRFKVTASGKVLSGPAGKRHGMIKRTNTFIRDSRGMMVLFEADGDHVKQMLPYPKLSRFSRKKGKSDRRSKEAA